MVWEYLQTRSIATNLAKWCVAHVKPAFLTFCTALLQVADVSTDPNSMLVEMQTISTLPEDFQGKGIIHPNGMHDCIPRATQ